jgi:hypothetical protein
MEKRMIRREHREEYDPQISQIDTDFKDRILGFKSVSICVICG